MGKGILALLMAVVMAFGVVGCGDEGEKPKVPEVPKGAVEDAQDKAEEVKKETADKAEETKDEADKAVDDAVKSLD
jgi:hypothetical protein